MLRALFTLLALSLPATAQTVPDQATAKRELFDTRGAQVVATAHDFLTEADFATLQALPKVAQLKYYGAMAAHPPSGLQSERTQGAFNFHSVEAARAAALRTCGRGCVIVADIVPRGYRPGRSLTLNQDASRAVDGRDFRRAGPNATLAISEETGAWALGDGGSAALATCAARGARDCVVAVSR
ncbi:hypothetical protein SAMN05444004_112111 [Jannaschia faecimaris]|uniref:5-aminolevulic acid synthase n=1 Tax=Jannaschia faecimaris TaxID=1244108 RepID=A0A1H3SLH9_9RHOB|nr:hypothetical protein [Jannaschia faecimaris]SDZ38856.1 hypothetical protein SAMN05444004_112111 [Jannaschia faecimaris]